MAFLQHPKQLGLQRGRHGIHFIEENRAFVRLFEQAEFVLNRARERAFFVTEKLGFQQIFRQRRTIDRHKRVMLTMRVKVQCARDEFFTSAALALNQNRAIGIGNFRDQIVDRLHLATRADNVLELVFLLQFSFEIHIFANRGLKI